MKILQVIALILFAVGYSGGIYAQKPYSMEDPDGLFYQAKDLFDKEKYGASSEMFNEFINSEGTGLLVEEAKYLNAICAVNLFNNDADNLLFQFIKLYPESQFHNEAVFEMGKLAYRDKRFGTAIMWMEEVDPLELSGENRTEHFFIKGYSYFRRERYQEARVAFYEILDSDDRYRAPALYYYSHIHYEQGNFETSLKGFLNLSSDETFSPIVPYYITHIYYQQKKWDEIIRYATPKLDSVAEKRYAEMAKIIGEAYFNKDMFKEALPYLEQFHSRVRYNTNEDKYQIGYAYYMVGNYKKATDYFKMVSIGKTELNQSANYHLADCYVKLGDKKQARLSFYTASNMDFNKEIKEDALFNYAVVTYELSISPFNEAVQGFSRYISLYPASDRTDEAYNYMVLAFMNTKNYRAAFAALERISRKTQDIEKSYQRVAFFRGLELFNDLSFMEAVEKFDASLKYEQHDRALRALCYYWKGEAWYRMKDYEQALEFYQNFLQSDGAIEMEEYAVAHYNIGYTEFKKENFQEALNWFKRFENLYKGKNKRILGDAYSRIGDMYFMDASYSQAIEYYDKAISTGVTGLDYALFQKGISEGVMNNHEEKIAILGIVLNQHKSSTYTADALYETGRSYFILGQAGKAIPFYQKLLESHARSSYVPRALSQLGLIYYNQQDEESSLANYKRIVAEFPGTPEANNALLGIKNVYVENNKVDDYFSYVESLGSDINVTIDEQDSLVYLAAENIYMSGNCDEAIESLGSYIESFPSGGYLLNAHFYKAECHLKASELSNALISLNYVIRQARNAFTVPAVLAASRINFSSGNYAEALENYHMLDAMAETKVNLTEAKMGKMRCYYLLEEYANTIDAARDLLRDDYIAGELKREAHFKIAKSFLEQDRFALALEEFRIVSVEAKTIEGAESKYRLAELLFIRKEYEESKEVIFDFVELNTPHQYWMAKSFILLADIYMIDGDSFQALATLESIIDYYELTNDGVLDLARRRKSEIMKLEEEGQDRESGEEIEIEIAEGSQ
jgi:tetratricopeptide (TPR) repeat protein